MLTIYKNEAYLIEDQIKDYVKKVYKNINFSITSCLINDVLIGMDIIIYDNILNIEKSYYIELKEFQLINDFVIEIKNKIVLSLSRIMRDHFLI